MPITKMIRKQCGHKYNLSSKTAKKDGFIKCPSCGFKRKLKTFENKRIEENDFSMNHPCSFCSSFVSMVVQIPKTELLICKSCLTKMIETINNSIIRSTK